MPALRGTVADSRRARPITAARAVPGLRHRRGYTLIELGIVLAVSGILVGALASGLVEFSRNRMARRAAEEVATLQDAARSFFLTQTQRRWPGQAAIPPAGPAACNVTAAASQQAMQQLVAGGFVRVAPGMTNPVNPWGGGFFVAFWAPPGIVVTPGCLFGVFTDVPQAVGALFVSQLPLAACNDAVTGLGQCPTALGGAVPAGFVRCCSYAPKPGAAFEAGCVPPQRLVYTPAPVNRFVCN